MTQQLWRVRRVAKLLDVSKKRVYQMVREGKLKAISLGPRSMRVTKESVDLWMANNVKYPEFEQEPDPDIDEVYPGDDSAAACPLRQ